MYLNRPKLHQISVCVRIFHDSRLLLLEGAEALNANWSAEGSANEEEEGVGDKEERNDCNAKKLLEDSMGDRLRVLMGGWRMCDVCEIVFYLDL